ncbi:distal tail protein Dit [Niallia sp. FSL K6-0212]|uniref:distal tail protein Dit n=1 Tax=Niallia sp. FSL K6-0212 TaxID=2921423 RepID=UPI0030F598E0
MSFYMRYNGIILPIKVKEVGGRGPLSQNVIRSKTPNRPGTTYKKKEYPERPLPVSFYLLETTSLEELREQVDSLSAMLDVEGPKPTVFSDEPSKVYYSILDGEPDWEEIKHYGKGVLPMLRLDPLKYGQEKTVTSTTIINEGTASCTPIFNVEFTSAANEFRVQNEDGKFVRVIWAFVAGDKLVVDFKKRKITINYTVRMTSLDFSSNWFELRPGENKLTVTPSSVATTTITYTPRWL